jgi:hypothetical protein
MMVNVIVFVASSSGRIKGMEGCHGSSGPLHQNNFFFFLKKKKKNC